MDRKKMIFLFAFLGIAIFLFGCVNQSANVTNSTSNNSGTSNLSNVSVVATGLCGSKITNDTTLTADLNCPSTALVITADNVTLDCAGYNITGPGLAYSKYEGMGIYTSHSNVTIENCNINGFDKGIDLEVQADNNTITNNNVSSNWEGIYLDTNSINNSIVDNNVNSNGYLGIGLYTGLNNIVSDNDIGSNGYGIWLQYYSNNNTLIDNNISSSFQYGIYLTSSANNTIYNNFLNNSVNVQLDPASAPNFWNATQTMGKNIVGGSKLGGNYWVGFSDSQSSCNPQSNGFCNSSYAINSSNVDYLPLTNPIPSNTTQMNSSSG